MHTLKVEVMHTLWALLIFSGLGVWIYDAICFYHRRSRNGVGGVEGNISDVGQSSQGRLDRAEQLHVLDSVDTCNRDAGVCSGLQESESSFLSTDFDCFGNSRGQKR